MTTMVLVATTRYVQVGDIKKKKDKTYYYYPKRDSSNICLCVFHNLLYQIKEDICQYVHYRTIQT